MTRSSDREPLTRAMILRALVKALCLFAIFNLIYGLLLPVKNGLLPTLYNAVFHGRERFMRGYEFDPYRLVSDHVISHAQSDTFNIVILGSSEIWGSRTGPAQSIPMYLDHLNMVAADGRPVRVYNLGYPFPYGFKDLTVLQAAVTLHIPIDLVILSTFDTTLSLQSAPHAISSANLTMERFLIDHYGLPPKYFDEASVKANDFGPIFLPMWNDRDALSAWASMQARGLVWGLMDDDIDESTEVFRQLVPALNKMSHGLTLDRVDPENTILRAFAQFQHETSIPIVILDVPVPVDVNEFAPWLQDQTQALDLPLIDCWNIYRDPRTFEDFYHIRREIHESYAHILAKALNDRAFEGVVTGLPLKLPTDFVMPPETCAVDRG